MKKIKIFFLLLLFCSSCRYRDHIVKISFDKDYANKFTYENYNKITLKVDDIRENKEFIGYRLPTAVWKFKEEYKKPNSYPEYEQLFTYKISKLTNNQELSQIIKPKVLSYLNKKGFVIEKNNTNQLKIEVLELNLIPTFYRNSIQSKIKVTALNKNSKLEKVYKNQITSYRPMFRVLLLGPFDFGAGDGYYDEIISECLEQNIKKIVDDTKILAFLKS